MMRAAGNNSGVGRLTHLHAFAERAIKAEGTGALEFASPFMRIKPRANLDMPDAKIAQPRRARKWCTDYSAHKNSFHNLSDIQRRICMRSPLCLAPSSLTAEPRAISHAQSPELNPRQTKGPVASWAERRVFMCVRERHTPQPSETQQSSSGDAR